MFYNSWKSTDSFTSSFKRINKLDSLAKITYRSYFESDQCYTIKPKNTSVK